MNTARLEDIKSAAQDLDRLLAQRAQIDHVYALDIKNLNEKITAERLSLLTLINIATK